MTDKSHVPLAAEPLSAALRMPCGRVALIDASDLPLLDGFKLYSEVRKHTVYVQCHKKGLPNGRYVYLHVLIMARRGIDHEDGDGLNNRRRNMRPATHKQNARNRHKHDGKNNFKGVTWMPHVGKWRVQIVADYKWFNGGLYADEIAAARVYDTLALFHHGEFARLNFPGATP